MFQAQPVPPYRFVLYVVAAQTSNGLTVLRKKHEHASAVPRGGEACFLRSLAVTGLIDLAVTGLIDLAVRGLIDLAVRGFIDLRRSRID